MTGRAQLIVEKFFALVLSKSEALASKIFQQRTEPCALETHVSGHEDTSILPERAIDLLHNRQSGCTHRNKSLSILSIGWSKFTRSDMIVGGRMRT